MGFLCLQDALYASNVAVWLEFCLRKINFSDRVGLEADQLAIPSGTATVVGLVFLLAVPVGLLVAGAAVTIRRRRR